VTGPPGTLNYYFWNLSMPSGRSGRAILYIQWIRSDSSENFFSCSDIVFDGGNGQVTGVGPNQSQPPPTSVSQPPPPSTTTTRPGTPTTGTNTNTPPGACTARYRTVNEWNAGFQGEVTVTAGTAPVSGWTVRWTNPPATQVTQIWSGTYSASGSAASVTNVNYNGQIAANGSTQFGFLGTGTALGTNMTITCSSP
jgi:predicted carbohydrate-binding protein with CBM5 and CBM33 domain